MWPTNGTSQVTRGIGVQTKHAENFSAGLPAAPGSWTVFRDLCILNLVRYDSALCWLQIFALRPSASAFYHSNIDALVRRT